MEDANVGKCAGKEGMAVGVVGKHGRIERKRGCSNPTPKNETDKGLAWAGPQGKLLKVCGNF